jgi:hypothetical protein
MTLNIGSEDRVLEWHSSRIFRLLLGQDKTAEGSCSESSSSMTAHVWLLPSSNSVGRDPEPSSSGMRLLKSRRSDQQQLKKLKRPKQSKNSACDPHFRRRSSRLPNPNPILGPSAPKETFINRLGEVDSTASLSSILLSRIWLTSLIRSSDIAA